jgi:type IV secretory pathway VirB10-like protein
LIFDKTTLLKNEGDGMKPIAIVIILGFVCLTASGIDAEIYSWTDEKGVKHYSNTPPPDSATQIKTAQEIPPIPQVSQSREKIDEENFEAILEEQNKTNKSSTPTHSTTQQKPSRQERIHIEQEKLEEKLAYLENLPLDAFANSRSRNVVIGQVQYRLQQLLSDPDGYFDKYGF